MRLIPPSNNFVAFAATALLAVILGFAYGATFSNGCSDAIPRVQCWVAPNLFYFGTKC
jgi:hypothetical protein